MTYQNDFPTLNDADAVALWQQGIDAWNAWVRLNPKCNIDFKGVSFSDYDSPNLGISFQGFIFPDGVVDFSYAKFFDEVVDFSYAKFGNGYVNFNFSDFKTKNIYFSGTVFGKGDVDFRNIIFNDSNLHFSAVNFDEGNLSFLGTKFGNGDVGFIRPKFGDGDINFSNVRLGDGNLILAEPFCGANNFYFNYAHFGNGVFIRNIKNIEGIKTLSFRNASFSGPLGISSQERFPCLVDLTNTKTSHHVSLHDLKCVLPRQSNRKSLLFPKGDWATQKIATDENDIDRARRLKELAETNKDHDKAKEFHIIEMQAARTHKFPYDFLLKSEFWYEKLSDYGRGITLPLDWLFSVFLMGLSFYSTMSFSIKGQEFGWDVIQKSAIFSASQMFSFIPSNRMAQGRIIGNLFLEDVPDIIFFFAFFQSTCALILLFLLGLGLRHRYRI